MTPHGKHIRRMSYCILMLLVFCIVGIVLIDSELQIHRLTKLNIYHPKRNWHILKSWIVQKKLPYQTQQVVTNRATELDIQYPKSRRTKTMHIGFLKVHKAGSTTMQNMFFRFGLKHNLTIVVPMKDNYVLTKASVVVPKDFNGKYDIFACHSVYKKEFYDALIPTDSVKIAIIREPFERMVSAAHYYRDVFGTPYLKKIPKTEFITNLVRHPDLYEKGAYSYTRNSMGKDFGFSGQIRISNKEAIKSHLKTIESEITLVMLTERFDESLVLMRRLLNWSITDIIYLRTNSHKYNMDIISAEDMSTFRRTCFLDYAIYDHFKELFDVKVKAEGPGLKEEVNFFKGVLQQLQHFCSSDNGTTYLTVDTSPWDDAFLINKVDCKWMNTKEMSFISKIRNMYTSGEKLTYNSI